MKRSRGFPIPPAWRRALRPISPRPVARGLTESEAALARRAARRDAIIMIIASPACLLIWAFAWGAVASPFWGPDRDAPGTTLLVFLGGILGVVAVPAFARITWRGSRWLARVVPGTPVYELRGPYTRSYLGNGIHRGHVGGATIDALPGAIGDDVEPGMNVVAETIESPDGFGSPMAVRVYRAGSERPRR